VIVFFDTETERFRPGLMAPPIVCVQWCVDDGDARLMTKRAECTDGRGYWEETESAGNAFSAWAAWLLEQDLIVGHNAAYDLACLGAHDPALVPLIFRAYRENRVTDTMWRQKLADIGRGTYRGFFNSGAWIPLSYDLGSVGGRHGFKVNKDDPWRLRYHELADVPLAQWPADALTYALNDPEATRAAYVGQAGRYDPALLVDEFAQARKFWALQLASVWGLRTSLRGVMSLERGTTERLGELETLLKAPPDGVPPLVKPDGVRDTKAAKERMRKVCAEAGVEPRMTKGGKKGIPDICLDSDACNSVGDPLLEAYAELSSLKKVLSNDVKAMREGVCTPIHTHFDLAETGRCTSAGPNVQNPRRLPGVRECYVPRGYCA
jgi:hypothetical protein